MVGTLSKTFQDWQTEFKSRNVDIPGPKNESFRKFSLKGIDLNAILKRTDFTTLHWNGNSEEKPVDFSELSSLLSSAPTNFFTSLPISLVSGMHYREISGSHNWSLESDSAHQVSFQVVRVSKEEKASLCKSYRNTYAGAEPGFCTQLEIYILEQGSTLELFRSDLESADSLHFKTTICFLAKDSKMDFTDLNLGGYKSKYFHFPTLLGSGSEFKLTSVSAMSGRELRDQDVLATHLASHSKSQIEYRVSVQDRAHHIFTGNLHIPSGTKKVEASQMSRNLSLGPKARAEANPKLEVKAEDVSCTHGATVGEIDEEQLFYLLARGLNPEEAKKLLVFAFFGAVLDLAFLPEELKNASLQMIEEKLS